MRVKVVAFVHRYRDILLLINDICKNAVANVGTLASTN